MHLLLLHGAIGAKEQLEPLAGKLGSSFTVHTLNFYGHGGEAIPELPFSISLFADQVSNYLEENKIPHADVFGYSMGGYIAMYLAKQHPGKLNRIISLATKFHWDKETAAKEAGMLNTEKISEKIPAFAKQLEERHAPQSWVSILEKTKAMLLQMGNDNPLKPADYALINNPCLLLLGDKDKMISAGETSSVKDLLPNASMKILENTAHPIEQADMNNLVRIIMDFLS